LKHTLPKEFYKARLTLRRVCEKSRPFICLIALGAFLLTGCARFQPQPISPSQTAAELENRSLTNNALKIFLEKNLHRELADWPASSWDFEMLTLAAFYYHPDLAVARAQWNVAQAGIKTAGGRPNPSLSLVPGYDTTRSALSPWLPAVSFDIPIETAGKRGHRIAAAEHLSESARLNIATVAWQVRSQLRSSLIEFTAAQQRDDILERQVSLEEQVVKLLEQQVEAGAIARSETTTFRIALHKLRLDRADAQRQLTGTRIHLAEAIGVPSGALDAVKLSADGLSERVTADDLTSAEVRRAALQGRADILGALADYAATEATLQLEIAKQYPDVHLSPGYQFDQGDNKWTLGITFDLPVLNQNQGPIAEAKARREEAAAKFSALQVKVLVEIENAVAAFRVDEKNSVVLEALAQEQIRHREAIEAQVRAGAAEKVDALNAEVELAAGELALLDGRVKLVQSVVALEDAVQRPIDTLKPSIIEPRPLSAKENQP
jgi:outer membrane protein TolC